MSKTEKVKRMRAALSHQEYDRVPIGDFFWTGFMKKAREKWGEGFDPYHFFDLDYIVINPNMDPHVKDFEILDQKGEDILVKTGFEATVRRSGDKPMPHFEEFSIKQPDDMANFTFEDDNMLERLERSGDDQINCLGDALVRNIPSWKQRIEHYKDDFCVFGSICEMYEFVWRIVGTENVLYWIALEPEKFKAFVQRAADFMQKILEAQIEAGKGILDGMYIWGDVAYVNGMMFSPEMWREVFKPHVERYIKTCHDAGLMVVYHGCGDARAIYEDFVDMGLDAYNPLEAKAHLDVVEIEKDFRNRLAFVGNIDVRELESGDKNRIKKELLYKLRAANGGGWICQSDHSVSSGVAPESYAYLVELLKDYGKQPLDMQRIDAELAKL